jgi:hypothetical protein
MVQFDPATGSLALPIWMAATLAALIVALLVLAITRSGAIRTLSALVGLAIVGYAVWASSIVIERFGPNDRVGDLRAFEQRAQGLLALAMQSGSSLSCLDQGSNEQVMLGCERAVFASPESVAAAVTFVSARLGMLVDGLDASARAGDASYDNVLAQLRSGLESDPFGIVAHVFLQQANCQPEQCEALALLRDPNKVRVHLQDKTFDTLVTRHSTAWGQSRPMADAGRGAATAVVNPAPSSVAGAPVSSKYEFPSAASIPPVSIMNSEPAQPVTAPAAAAASPAAAPREAREPRRPPGVRPAPAARAAAQEPPARAAPTARASAQEPPAPVQLAPGGAPTTANGPPRSTAQ